MLFIFAMTWVTSSREIYINGSLYMSWVLYFAGPLAYFDNFIKSIYFAPNQNGLSSLMGLIGYGLTPFAAIFGLPESINFYFDRQNSVSIGLHHDFNAFGTMMLDGYYDFGFAGIFMLSIFAGFLTSKFTTIAKNTDSPFYVCLSAMSFSWIIFFPIGWTGGMQFAFGQAPISILMLYALTKFIRQK